MCSSSGNRLQRGAHRKRLIAFALLLTCAVWLLSGCSVQPRFDGSGYTPESKGIERYFSHWRGTPYRLGGTTSRGLDCSAFVQNLYTEVYGLPLARTTESQSRQGYQVLPGELEPGDLIFFKTGWRTRHVGVYLGDGEFVHASTSAGVTRSRLNSDYWRDNFWQARRLIN